MDLVTDMLNFCRGQWVQIFLVCHIPSCIFLGLFLLHLNPEMMMFAYYGIRWDEFEGTSCYSSLGESSVAPFRLILVRFCTLFEWLTLWLRPRWRSTSTVDGVWVSKLASIPCTDVGSYFMPMGALWGSDPGGRYWVPSSSESSCQSSLDRGMNNYSLLCHYFARVKFSCIASSEWSSTMFFQFTGTVPFLIFSIVDIVS